MNTISDIKPCSKGYSHINTLKCKPKEEADEATTRGHKPDNNVPLWLDFIFKIITTSMPTQM